MSTPEYDKARKLIRKLKINTTTKREIIDQLIRVEGGYVNNPNDSGGATNYGITQGVALDQGYNGHMKDLHVDFARRVYSERYWDKANLDKVFKASPLIATYLFDMAVNMGVSRAGAALQRALNLLTDDDLMVDSKVGGNTIIALNNYLRIRKGDDETLCKIINALKAVHYIECAEKRPKDRTFIYGWIKQRVW